MKMEWGGGAGKGKSIAKQIPVLLAGKVRKTGLGGIVVFRSPLWRPNPLPQGRNEASFALRPSPFSTTMTMTISAT